MCMSSLWFKYCGISKYHGKLLYHVRVCLILEGPDKTFLYIDFLLLVWVILFHHYSVHSMSVCVQNAFLMYVRCRIKKKSQWNPHEFFALDTDAGASWSPDRNSSLTDAFLNIYWCMSAHTLLCHGSLPQRAFTLIRYMCTEGTW